MPPLARTVRSAAALAALLAAAPAPSAPGARCSIPHAEAWREYRSAHVVLATDVPRERAALLVAELEKLHALVLAALFGEGVDVPGRVHVVAFSDPRRFEELAPPHADGYVTTGGLGDVAIVFPYQGWGPVPEVLAHELAHRISRHHFPRQPRWFSEGLAMFVQTVARVHDGEHTAPLGSHLVRGVRGGAGRYAGLASPELLLGVRASLDVSAKELLEWRGAIDDADPGRFHAKSWLLYHWLWNQRSSQFTAFQERLASGEAPGAAWRAAFPEWDPARPESLEGLDRALAAYWKAGRYAPYPVDVSQVDAAFTDAPLGRADLHMLLLDVRARARWPLERAERRALVGREVEEALSEDPTHPVATWRRATERAEPPAPALRAVTAARPGDSRGWLLLASALDASADAAEKEAALRRAVALDAGSARANNELAWLLVSTNRAREARPFADRALDLAPWNPTIVDTLAAVAAGIGQCKAAVALQRRAADHYPPDGEAGRDVRARLARYEAGCDPATPAPR